MMKRKADEWTPDDVISMIALIGLIILIAVGHDNNLVRLFIAINGAYLLGTLRHYRPRK